MEWLRRTFRWKNGRRAIRHTSKYGGKISVLLDDTPPSIAAFMTPSLKEILKIFNKKIVFLKASGERNIEKKDIGLSNFGLKLNLKSNNSCEMVYKNRYMDRRKHDDLTEENIDKIFNLLENQGIPDCSVSEVIIQFESEELKEMLGTRDNLFFAHLILHQCENEKERDIWKKHEVNDNPRPMGLLQQGFKHSVLHCIRLIDNHQLRTVPKRRRKHHIYWIERNKDLKDSDIDYHSNSDIALLVKVNLPKYGVLKNYKREKATGLVLSSIEE